MLADMLAGLIDEETPVLALGAAGVDVIGKIDQPLAEGTSIPAQIRTSFGGVARNISENLARLGRPVRLVSAVGEDANGKALLAHTAASGVDVSHILQSADYPTGFYMGIVSNESNLLTALDDMRVLQAIDSAHLKAHSDLFKDAGLLFIDANLSPKALRTAFSLARKYKVPVAADPTSVNLASRLQSYLPRITLLSLNALEAASLLQETASFKVEQTRQMARQLINLGVDIVLVALAEKGVVYATSETNGFVPAIRTTVTDWTGAGDALTAAVIYGLMNGIPIDESVQLGVAAASLTLQHSGSVYPYITEESLYNHLSL